MNELAKALKGCGKTDTSPGPDGIPYKLYKKFWNILGPELVKCWEYSMEVGKLSPDQRYSVITLIPKPGKDTSKISNLRPISLTNTDVKIITKAFTDRFANILPDIINCYQTAYVKGRQITDNNYAIDKLIQLAEELEENMFLVSLDARKAFDSVNHEYKLAVLRAFGCGERMVKTVKTLYTELISSVMVNGYKTTVFKLLRGVKQGDALSCVLFIMCMEPLIRKMQDNPEIQAINIRPLMQIGALAKIFAYADDINAFVKGTNSVKVILKEYERFSKCSGIYINADKTEILRVGPHKHDMTVVQAEYLGRHYDIQVLNKVKICGIYHPMSSPDCYNLNITTQIGKLQTQLNIWRPRALTLMGKILIVKTFGLSQLVYRLQTCFITEEDIKKTEQICYNFIWNGKSGVTNDKVKRALLKNEYDKGGLKAPCIETLDKNLKVRKVLRISKSHLAPIQEKIFSLYGIKSLISADYNRPMIAKIKCKNLQKVVKTLGELHNQTIGTIMTKQIDDIEQGDIDYLSRQELVTTRHNIKVRNFDQIVRRLYIHNIRNLGDLITKQFGEHEYIFAIARDTILRSYPPSWVNLLSNKSELIQDTAGSHELLNSDGQYIETKALTSKIMKSILQKGKLCEYTNQDVVRKFNIATDVSWNAMAYFPARDTYLRTMNYKILTDSYVTRHKLCKMRIIDSSTCIFCEEEDDDLNHAIIECPVSRLTWDNMQSVLTNIGVNTEMNKQTIIFGLAEGTRYRNVINAIMINIKNKLASPRSTERHLSVELNKKLMKDQFEIERVADVIRTKKDLKTLVDKRWKDLMSKLN